jgi:hypothetical protein
MKTLNINYSKQTHTWHSEGNDSARLLRVSLVSQAIFMVIVETAVQIDCVDVTNTFFFVLAKAIHI